MIYIGYTEMWKRIIINGCKTNYEVSSMGNIRKFNNKKILSLNNDTSKRTSLQLFGNITGNYKSITLSYTDKNNIKQKIKKPIHRLVAEAFIPIPKKYIKKGYTEKDLVVDHIRDWDPNNHKDNTIYNLQWLTKKENTQKFLKYKNAFERPRKYTKEEAKEIILDYKSKYDNPQLIHNICKELIKNEKPMSEIAKMFNVKKGFVNDIKLQRCWQNITYLYDLDTYDVKEGQVYSYNKSTLDLLDEYIESGLTNDIIRKKLEWERNKTTSALISKHRKKLNKNVSKRTVYSNDFIDQLHKLMKEGKSNKEIKEFLNLESNQQTYNLFAVHRKILGLK